MNKEIKNSSDIGCLTAINDYQIYKHWKVREANYLAKQSLPNSKGEIVKKYVKSDEQRIIDSKKKLEEEIFKKVNNSYFRLAHEIINMLVKECPENPDAAKDFMR